MNIDEMSYTGAWFGDADLKAEVMQRLYLHREQDDFIQGTYQQVDTWTRNREGNWERVEHPDYKGCAIGCTLPLQAADSLSLRVIEDWHARVESLYNIPAMVTLRIDNLFESQDDFEQAGRLAVTSMESIAVGADLRGLAAEIAECEVEKPCTCVEPYDQINQTCQACYHDCQLCGFRDNTKYFLDRLATAPVAPGARALILVG
jgi:hypothetical protein